MMRQFMMMSLALLFASTVSFAGFKGKWVASRMEEIQNAAQSIQDNAQSDMVKEKAQMIHDTAGHVHKEAKHAQNSGNGKSKSNNNGKSGAKNNGKSGQKKAQQKQMKIQPYPAVQPPYNNNNS